MAQPDASVRVVWGPGPLEEALRSSYENRIRQFIIDEESEPIQLFSNEARGHSMAGDWYGEHAGKWLVTAAHAWRRTQDEDLRESLSRVADYLCRHQEQDGYLGTYSPDYEGRLSKPEANAVRTWDLWVHAWLILGLLEISEVVSEAKGAALRIGTLILREFGDDGRSIVDIGNHQGLSSAVLIHPLAELSLRTGDSTFAAFARSVLQQMEDRGLPILSGPDQGLDISTVGTGKSYQLCWILVGLTALYRATGEDLLRRAAEYWWQNISNHHLTPMGGPWGGIGTHKEVFNQRGFFSPYGLTETCATASWMALCRELFLLTGESRFINAFERSLNNALLGAMDENGRDWCYFTFPNGRRNNTYHWACCKSSGAMALEEAVRMGVSVSEFEIALNLWQPQRVTVKGQGLDIRLTQELDRILQKCSIRLDLDGSARLTVAVRLPAGSRFKATRLNGEPVDFGTRDDYIVVDRTWSASDVLEVEVAFDLKVNALQYSLDHHGQEIVRTDYVHLTWGPYVYATGLIDGYKKEETIRLAKLTPEAPFSTASSCSANGFPVFNLIQPSRPAIPFLPYFEASGRHDGAWRSTWIQVAWQ